MHEQLKLFSEGFESELLSREVKSTSSYLSTSDFSKFISLTMKLYERKETMPTKSLEWCSCICAYAKTFNRATTRQLDVLEDIASKLCA